VNRDRILKVADVIEANPEHFDMTLYFNDAAARAYQEQTGASVCSSASPFVTPEVGVEVLATVDLTNTCGTTACIAGWAMHLWPADVTEKNLPYSIIAADLLDIDYKLADDLFYDMSLDAENAVRALREIAETGDYTRT
jgi:hypothetical protein